VNFPQWIVCHYSNIETRESQLKQIESYHKSKRFPKSSLGFHTGYHFVIDTDASLHQMRADWDRGAHAVNCGHKDCDITGLDWNLLNYRSIGICVCGGVPSAEQMLTLRDLIFDIRAKYDIKWSNVVNHYQTRPTKCPGFDMVESMIAKLPNEVLAVVNHRRIADRRIGRLRAWRDRTKGERRKSYNRRLKRALRRFKNRFTNDVK